MLVARALLETRDDQNANVRCMVLLAAGNLGQGLSSSGVEMDRSVWLDLCDFAVGFMKDINERVVATAIRATGHLFSGYLRVCHDSGVGGDANRVEDLGERQRV